MLFRSFPSHDNFANKKHSLDAAIQVGGRNLYLNSQTIKSYSKGSDQGNASYWQNIVEGGIEFTRIAPINNGNFYFYPILHTTPFSIKQDEFYTVSFEYRHNKEGDIGLYNYLLAPSISRQIPPSESWNKFTATYTVTEDKTVNSSLFGFANLVAGQSLDIKNLKLEKGNKATDWTLAPEDVQAEIDAAEAAAKLYTEGWSEAGATKNIIYRQPTAPTGANGDLWYDTDAPLKPLYRHNGTTWEEIGIATLDCVVRHLFL